MMKLIDPPRKNIFETHTPYDDLFTTNSQGWIIPDNTRIKYLCKRYDFLLINCSSEHWGSERDYPLVARICDILIEHGCQNFVCLSHDPYDEALRPQIMYFPFWAHIGRSIFPMPNEYILQKSKRTYYLSNLNKFTRDFRIANYLKLLEKTYVDRCLVSMHNAPKIDDYNGHFGLTETEINSWNNIKNTLPLSVNDGFDTGWQHDHPAFSDTYVHLASETTIKDKIFVTEKTWKTVAVGQIFLIWGNAGILDHLRVLGVDVFDDIINHSYDLESNHRSRLEKIHQEIDRLSTLDFEIIYKNTQDRRLENLRKFMQENFTKSYIKKLIDRLPPEKYNLQCTTPLN